MITTCILLAAFQSVSQMGDAAPPPPPHVVGPDGGTIADGDARAQERRRAAGHMADFNALANIFFSTPVGPAYPPGHVPNFNINAAAPFNPANMLAMMQVPANVSAVPAPMPPPLPAPRRPPTNDMRTAAAAAATGAASTTAGRPSTNTVHTAAAGNGRPAAAAPPPPAPAAPVAHQQRHQQNMMQNAAAREKKVDKTYRRNYGAYCRFVEEQGLATKAPYITTDGVNLYFSEVVSKETNKPETAGRRLGRR